MKPLLSFFSSRFALAAAVAITSLLTPLANHIALGSADSAASCATRRLHLSRQADIYLCRRLACLSGGDRRSPSRGGRPQEHLIATADTIGAINLLFHVSDKFQSTFDREKGCTTEFDKQTVEGRRQINSTLKLDYAQGKSTLDEKNLTTGQSKRLEVGIPSCLTDLLTGVFYASSQPMTVGKSFDMPVSDPQKTVVVTMKVEGREELKLPAGTFNTVRVEPTADAGVVKNRGQIWIWYTDDDRHLPVQMRARSFWGTITFRLASVENK